VEPNKITSGAKHLFQSGGPAQTIMDTSICVLMCISIERPKWKF